MSRFVKSAPRRASSVRVASSPAGPSRDNRSAFCLGAYLARAEIGAVLAGLRDLVADMERTGPARPVYSNFLSGLSSLPLALKAS
ncbi:hypothetical protein ACIRVK_29180 [Streptomyces sp. NPDC101152]|uniref:hypothetical protein n=1 Tax=Streptomyces sp. NPDC101152 TaxID=3366116 RepID=UPI003809FDD6